jgi:hypothetical protein
MLSLNACLCASIPLSIPKPGLPVADIGSAPSLFDPADIGVEGFDGPVPNRITGAEKLIFGIFGGP